jgi:hypothetical protein
MKTRIANLEKRAEQRQGGYCQCPGPARIIWPADYPGSSDPPGDEHCGRCGKLRQTIEIKFDGNTGGIRDGL